MGRVVRIGSGDPDNPEVTQFENMAGSSTELAIVDAMSHERIRSALSLWTAGATYGDIATQFNFQSPRIAMMAIERALSEQVDDATDRTKLRRRMSLTLDRFLKAITPKAVDPTHPEQLAAVRAGLSIVDRFARLHGLDAPTEVTVRMPGNEDFNKFIELAARGQGMEVPVEADPFEYEDAEIVEDEDDESGS